MKYSIKAHPTTYKGTVFRSRLEARWACFMDLIGLRWEYEPLDLNGWTPDFRVEIRTGHSGCPDPRVLLAEVKPYHSIKEFEGHPCMQYPYGQSRDGGRIPACSSAAFGANPGITWWEWVRSNSSGQETLATALSLSFATTLDDQWAEAGNITRWAPPTQPIRPEQIQPVKPEQIAGDILEVVVKSIAKHKSHVHDCACALITMVIQTGGHAGEDIRDIAFLGHPDNAILAQVGSLKLKALGRAAGTSREFDLNSFDALTSEVIGKRIKIRIRRTTNARTGKNLACISTYIPLVDSGAKHLDLGKLSDLAMLPANSSHRIPRQRLADLARPQPLTSSPVMPWRTDK